MFTTWWVPVTAGHVIIAAKARQGHKNDEPLLELLRSFTNTPNVANLQRMWKSPGQGLVSGIEQGETNVSIETTSGWPCLEDKDGRFQPNPPDTINLPDKTSTTA